MKFRKIMKFISIAFTLALLGLFIIGAPAAAANSTLGLTTSSGPPGSVTTVYGTWTTPQTYFVLFDGQLIGATTLPSQQLSLEVTIPLNATSGAHTIMVQASTDGYATPLQFNVTAGVILSPNHGNVGDSVTVTGSGFAANASVSIVWDGVTNLKTVQASSSGAISTTVTIPDATRGDHTITTNPVSSATTFKVNSKIVLDKTSGGAGSSVGVTGTGFAANSMVTLTIGGVSFTPNVTATTGSNGKFNTAFTVPANAARGLYTIRASDGGGYAETVFTVAQSISISLPSGQSKVAPGDVITVSGHNFSTGAVTFKLDGSLINLTATADASGFIDNITYTIPNIAAGTHRLTAVGSDLYEAYADFTVGPKVTLTPVEGTVGSQVTVSGSGFAANSAISVALGSNTVVTGNTDTSGNIAGSLVFTIPAGISGTQSISVKDNYSNSATATFKVKSRIALSATSGSYDETINVNGSGFIAGSTIILTIQSGQTEYSLTAVPTEIKVETDGSFSAAFTVPLLHAGNWNVKAYVGNNVEASATLAVKSRIALSPGTAASGVQIAVAGYGFNPSKSITLKYNNVPLATGGISTDTNGYFTAAFNVPASAAGTFVVEASDGFTTAKTDFTAVAGATISVVTDQNAPGYVGLEVTISGTGFKASSPISVIFESTPVQVASVTSKADGSFSATFKIPAAVKGSHTIKASDGTTTKEFPFYMEGDAPGKPNLAAPVDKYKPKQPVPFSWYGVSDPSGVTYEFQLSLDPTFKTVLLDKTGLTGNSYTLSAADSFTVDGKLYIEGKLPSAGSKTPYNWRVRAIDGAGNAGEWSAVNTFTIGFIMPGWMIHVWYGLGILVALVLGMWLGRRMAYQSY